MKCSDDKGVENKKVSLPKPIKAPKLNFFLDYDLDKNIIIRDTVRKNDTFAEILKRYGVPYSTTLKTIKKIKKRFNTRSIKPKQPFEIIFSKDSLKEIQGFIYHKTISWYYNIDFRDSIYVEKCRKYLTRKQKIYSGTIKNSLWETIDYENLDLYLVNLLSDIFAWNVDFFHMYSGDRFKVILEEGFLETGHYVGIQKVFAAVFESQGETFYAFRYVDKRGNEYFFDEKGESTRRTFLKAPLSFSRISSRYSGRRFHPILKRWKSHKGTDFAAPKGTPIMSTADGRVIKSSYTPGNGKYVKIYHNSVYETQYLHMSRRAVRKGQYVKQGDIIGYVGSTGLATGPHVCYRFWKNGRQVDPFRQRLPKKSPISVKVKEQYLESIRPLKKLLDNTPFSKEIK